MDGEKNTTVERDKYPKIQLKDEVKFRDRVKSSEQTRLKDDVKFYDQIKSLGK